MNFRLKVLLKRVKNVVNLSEMWARLTFRDRTADITYCTDATVFLHSTSGGLSCLWLFSAPISCVLLF